MCNNLTVTLKNNFPTVITTSGIYLAEIKNQVPMLSPELSVNNTEVFHYQHRSLQQLETSPAHSLKYFDTTPVQVIDGWDDQLYLLCQWTDLSNYVQTAVFSFTTSLTTEETFSSIYRVITPVQISSTPELIPPIATIGNFVIFLAFLSKVIVTLYFTFFVFDMLKAPKAK